VVESHAGLAEVGAMALDRPDWLNMELAVPLARYADFERMYKDGGVRGGTGACSRARTRGARSGS